MIGKRPDPEDIPPKILTKSKKVKSEVEEESVSSSSEDELRLDQIDKGFGNEEITFEFFPANIHFQAYIKLMLKKNYHYFGPGLGKLAEKICDQTEMGIFVGTGDDTEGQAIDEETDDSTIGTSSVL